MNILKDSGYFEILSKPENVIGDIATAARTCYQSHDKSTPENDKKLVENLMKREHYAMFEFSTMSVNFKNVSRGFTHEAVRHRLASFAQESTRYVDESDFKAVVPPHKDENEMIDRESLSDGKHCDLSLMEMLNTNELNYRSLRKFGWKLEDARQVLPIAIKTQIVIGANIREWRHIFHMRCDIYAHWEIRGVMLKLLKWCQENIPIVFDDFHFFKTEDGKEYARKVMPFNNLKDRIKEHLLIYQNKDELLTFIQNL